MELVMEVAEGEVQVMITLIIKPRKTRRGKLVTEALRDILLLTIVHSLVTAAPVRSLLNTMILQRRLHNAYVF